MLSITYDSDNGVLTINSVDVGHSLQVFQSALRSVQFFSFNSDPGATDRSVVVETFFESTRLASSVATIFTTTVNGPPQLDLDTTDNAYPTSIVSEDNLNAHTTFTEGAGPVALTPNGLIFDDVDVVSTITLTASALLPDGSSEQFTFASQTGATISQTATKLTLQ